MSDSAEKQTPELAAEPQTPEPVMPPPVSDFALGEYTNTVSAPVSSSARPDSQTVEQAKADHRRAIHSLVYDQDRPTSERTGDVLTTEAALILAVRQEQADARPARTLKDFELFEAGFDAGVARAAWEWKIQPIQRAEPPTKRQAYALLSGGTPHGE